MATVRYTRGGDTFEWDSEKAAENLRKHEISFELACEVFADPFLLFTDASVPEEPRDAVIGYTTTHQLLFVVHVEATPECLRLISARRATPQERRQYEEDR
jgi:uncharacterized DUF497 family protein